MKLHDLVEPDMNEGIAKTLGIAGLVGAGMLGLPKDFVSNQAHSTPTAQHATTSSLGRTRVQGTPATPAPTQSPSPTDPAVSATAPSSRAAPTPPAVQQPSVATSTSSHANAQHERYLKQQAMAAGITGDELAAFLAQTAHETMGFKSLYEFGSKDYFKKKYDIKFDPAKAELLGNVAPGDGVKYRGRGYIHLTGRFNYRRAGRALNLPLEKKPHLAAEPETAAKIAIWFWKNRVRPVTSDWNDVSSHTKPINSGLKGLSDREANYLNYKAQLQPVKK